MRVAIGVDHGGFVLKSDIISMLEAAGHALQDLGAYELDATDDFPDFAKAVAISVSIGEADRGIVICGSGVGASVAANKIQGVRAAVCHDTYSARQGVEHDDMNVLCLGARVIGIETARQLVIAFLSGTFIDEEKYRRRLDKVNALEQFSVDSCPEDR
jgi:ribose 5-phosphate isomerase B